jgi:prolyl-tRNA editing enzyme YbaK/EbsC (Cys-tRNA(Pro) deacylase)
VRAATGFEPGAVAPFPVADATRVLVERELLRQATVWAGAGSSNHMVGLSPLDIVRVTRAEVADLSEA